MRSNVVVNVGSVPNSFAYKIFKKMSHNWIKWTDNFKQTYHSSFMFTDADIEPLAYVADADPSLELKTYFSYSVHTFAYASQFPKFS